MVLFDKAERLKSTLSALPRRFRRASARIYQGGLFQVEMPDESDTPSTQNPPLVSSFDHARAVAWLEHASLSDEKRRTAQRFLAHPDAHRSGACVQLGPAQLWMVWAVRRPFQAARVHRDQDWLGLSLGERDAYVARVFCTDAEDDAATTMLLAGFRYLQAEERPRNVYVYARNDAHFPGPRRYTELGFRKVLALEELSILERWVVIDGALYREGASGRTLVSDRFRELGLSRP